MSRQISLVNYTSNFQVVTKLISSTPAHVQPAPPFVAPVPLSNSMELTLEDWSTGSESDAEEGK